MDLYHLGHIYIYIFIYFTGVTHQRGGECEPTQEGMYHEFPAMLKYVNFLNFFLYVFISSQLCNKGADTR